MQRTNLNRFVRYEAEVKQSENTHSLSLFVRFRAKKGGRKPQNIPLTERRCTLLCEKDICAMKLTRNRNVQIEKDREGALASNALFVGKT